MHFISSQTVGKRMSNEKNDKRDKAINAISKDPYRIIKGNPIINAKFDISAIQMKIFLHMIASIDQAKDSIPIIKITVKDFQRLTGINSNNIYAHVEKEAMKMREKRIFFSNNKITFDANLISAFVYYKDEGYFTLEIPQALHPFLLQIKENFTVLDIRNILRLDSVYAMRFYEFCKEYERFGKFRFDVDELKATLGLSARYKNYFDFKKKVIEQAKKELSLNAEIYFEYQEIKNGKKVESIEFYIKKNIIINDDVQTISIIKNPDLGNTSDDKNDRDVIVEQIFQNVKVYEITLKTVENWVKEFPYEQIILGIDYVLNEVKAGKPIANVGGYLNQMVRNPTLFEKKTLTKADELKKKQLKKEELKKQDEVNKLEAKKEELKIAYSNAKRKVALTILESNPELYLLVLNKLQGSLLGQMNYNSYMNFCEKNTSNESFIKYFSQDASFFAGVMNAMSSEFPEILAVKAQFDKNANRLGIQLI